MIKELLQTSDKKLIIEKARSTKNAFYVIVKVTGQYCGIVVLNKEATRRYRTDFSFRPHMSYEMRSIIKEEFGYLVGVMGYDGFVGDFERFYCSN